MIILRENICHCILSILIMTLGNRNVLFHPHFPIQGTGVQVTCLMAEPVLDFGFSTHTLVLCTTCLFPSITLSCIPSRDGEYADLLFKGDFRIPGDLCGLWWWPYQGRGLLQCHVEDHEKVSLIPKGFSMDGWLGLNAVDDPELLLIIYASGFCLMFRICLWKECYRWAGSYVRTQGKSGSCLAPGHHCSLMLPQLLSWMLCWWVACKIWVWHKCKSIFDF